MPFRAFSSGGIVKRPTVGLVGEGGQNEAVVPLPDGKAIPVKMQGGDERTIVVRNEWTINTLDANGFDQLLASRKSTSRTTFCGSSTRDPKRRAALWSPI